MATKTTNYNLTKPDLTDWADIRVLNANMDIIDSTMKAISDLADSGGGGDAPPIDLSAYALKSQLNGYLPLTGGDLTGMITINGKEVALKTTNKTGTKKGEEQSHWKTYLPDGRVMFKVNVGSQSVVTLPVTMANTQYSVIQCDATVQLNGVGNATGDYEAYVCNRGISDKTTTSFKVWSVRRVGQVEYKSANWNERYTGSCEAIIIGWEA